MFYEGKKAFVTHRWWLHVMRGILVCIAISLWGQGMQRSPITTATIISFSVPIFVLVLAPFILKERVTWPLWLATSVGFVGILYMVRPTIYHTDQGVLFFFIAALFFAVLDILNKKYVVQESMLSMLFYSNVVAAVLVLYPTVQVWCKPPLAVWIWLFILGVGSNLILYCLLRAFAWADASWLAPFRFLEFFISLAVGYVCFAELPPAASYWGAAFIIPCTLFVTYYQLRD